MSRAGYLCFFLSLFSLTSSGQDIGLRQAQQTLLRRKSSTNLWQPVSPAVRTATARFKDQLVRSTDAAVAGLPPSASAADATGALSTAFPAETVGQAEFDAAANVADASTPNRPKFIAGLFGSGLRTGVQKPRPDILLLDESFLLPCGDDHLLLLYRLRAGRWHRVLRWQSGRYLTVDHAFGDAFAVVPLHAQRHGLPMLLVKHGSPWCSSTSSMLSLTVLQLSPLGRQPHVLWRSEQEYRRFDLDYLSQAFATPDGFGVRTSFPDLDGDQLGKEVTRFYAVTPAAVSRAGPLGEDPADALDEWFQLPWREARLYVDPAHQAPLRLLHRRIFPEAGKDARPAEVSYLSVRSCATSTTRRQIEVDTRPLDLRIQHLAFVLYDAAANRPFRLAQAASDPACTGKDELHNEPIKPTP